LCSLLAAHANNPVADIPIAIETDRGLLVAALHAAGYQVYAINPKAVDRYRDRHRVSGAKSDTRDAQVLADIVRTDADRHRVLPDDSELVRSIVVLARAHQDALQLQQRETNRLRSLLREYFPAALQAFRDLRTRSALAILAHAPTPAAAAELDPSDLAQLMADAGRRGTPRAELHRIADAFAAAQLRQPPRIEQAMGEAARAIVIGLQAIREAVAELTTALDKAFTAHPDAGLITSLPALGGPLAASVLAEFGDDASRFPTATDRRAYAGTAPVTRESGKTRYVSLRRSRNARLSRACRSWAFTTLVHSPGARVYYDRCRTAGTSHETTLRKLAGKLLNQLHHCLAKRVNYDPTRAWQLPFDADTGGVS
jgi:transposase